MRPKFNFGIPVMAASDAGTSEVTVETSVRGAAPRAAAPVSDGNEQFPVPFRRFAARIQNTHDEVWTHHLRVQHGRENHTVVEWHAILERYRNEPAHPGL